MSMKRYIHTAVLLFLVSACLSDAFGASLAQRQEAIALGHDVIRSVTTSTSIVMRVKWIGAAGSGATLEVLSGGDMVFTTDGTTADTTVSTDGTIDLSTPAASEDTWGEVCDVINASGSWHAVLVDVLPSASSDNTAITMAETSTTTGKSATYNIDGNGLFDTEGLAIQFDVAQADAIYASVGPEHFTNEAFPVSNLLDRQAIPVNAGARWIPMLSYCAASANVTTGNAALNVYRVRCGSGNSHSASVEQVVFSTSDIGDNVLTVLGDDVGTSSFQENPLLWGGPFEGRAGDRFVIQVIDSSTPDITAARIDLHGRVFNER